MKRARVAHDALMPRVAKLTQASQARVCANASHAAINAQWFWQADDCVNPGLVAGYGKERESTHASLSPTLVSQVRCQARVLNRMDACHDANVQGPQLALNNAASVTATENHRCNCYSFATFSSLKTPEIH